MITKAYWIAYSVFYFAMSVHASYVEGNEGRAAFYFSAFVLGILFYHITGHNSKGDRHA